MRDALVFAGSWERERVPVGCGDGTLPAVTRRAGAPAEPGVCLEGDLLPRDRLGSRRYGSGLRRVSFLTTPPPPPSTPFPLACELLLPRDGSWRSVPCGVL